MTRIRAIERGSTVVFVLAAALAGGAALAIAHGVWRGGDGARLDAARALAEGAGATDLALFTEARYARHPAMADLHSAFQDGPSSFEHFPSGTLVAPARDFPPAGLRAEDQR